MNQLITVFIAASTLLSSAVLAGEKVDKSISAEDVKAVSIEVMRGKIDITGQSNANISVVGELDDEAEKFIFEKSGNLVTIKVKMPRQKGRNWKGNGSELAIKLPKNVKVNFQGVSTDINIEDNDKGVEVKTVSGNIIASNLAQRVELSVVSGDIKSESLSGKVNLSTVSGSISDQSSSGRVQLKAVSGDIEISSTATDVSLSVVSGDVDFELAEVDDLKVSSVSGDVEGQLTLNDDGNIKMSGVSSDFDIKLQKNVSANFKISSSAGGRIKNNLTNDKVKRAKYGPSSKLNFSTGDASGTFKASVVSGEIKISGH